jgi:PAS domain S-box-containing protein
MKYIWLNSLLLGSPALVLAAESHGSVPAAMTDTVYGYLSLMVFIAAYAVVPLENRIHLRKSKPLLAAAGIIWILLAVAYIEAGDTESARQAIQGNLLEYAELFLFLLAAMTYINTMEERHVFEALRTWLVSRGFSLRKIFWITGILSFFISAVADNLTTALLMGAVVLAVAGDNKKFTALACISIVVAANAGGAFSPFGDITTLMVWQKGKVTFIEFFDLFVPSAVNWLVPAAVMSLAVGKASPRKVDEMIQMKYGAVGVIMLFFLTIATAVCFQNFLHLPPAAGMMMGMAFLGVYSYHIKRHEGRSETYGGAILGAEADWSHELLRRLLERTTKLDAIIDTIPEPTFAIDMNHVVTHWNAACETLTGTSAKDMIGTHSQWKPFYPARHPMMADLIVDHRPEDVNALMQEHYRRGYRKNPRYEDAYDGSGFFPKLGDGGRWITFSALPLKDRRGRMVGAVQVLQDFTSQKQDAAHFDIMQRIAQAEWDTLLFFYGVILCVGGLAQFGYLAAFSRLMFQGLGTTMANVMVGILSAFVDNIPVMYAVLTMSPEMSHGQWLLVTLTTGVGGSLLSIGSAAGVGLMGTARGTYTFGTHLKWTPAIMAGYAASILVHLWINARLM